MFARPSALAIFGLFVGISASFASLAGCARGPVSAPSDTASIGIQAPLGGTRFLFVSPVDGAVWGVLCPGPVSTYAREAPADVLTCGYTQSYGPVAVGAFLAAMPADIDRYALEQDLRSPTMAVVTTSRDKYYEAWQTLQALAVNATPQPAPTASLNIEVSAANASLYFYATHGLGSSGSYVVSQDGTMSYSLNDTGNDTGADKAHAIVTLDRGVTQLYLQQAIADQVDVRTNGGIARTYYF